MTLMGKKPTICPVKDITNNYDDAHLGFVFTLFSSSTIFWQFLLFPNRNKVIKRSHAKLFFFFLLATEKLHNCGCFKTSPYLLSLERKIIEICSLNKLCLFRKWIILRSSFTPWQIKIHRKEGLRQKDTNPKFPNTSICINMSLEKKLSRSLITEPSAICFPHRKIPCVNMKKSCFDSHRNTFEPSSSSRREMARICMRRNSRENE